MKELLEQGLGVIVIGAVMGISILVRMILWGYYSRVGKACKELEGTRNKTILHIREDLTRRSQQNIAIKSATVYTECRLAECKVCGIRLGILEGILEQSVLLVVLSSVLSAFAGVVWGCEIRQVLLLLFVGGLSFFSLLLVDLFAGIREKHRRIRLTVRDYIENGRGRTGDQHVPTAGMPNREKRMEKKENPSNRWERKEPVKADKPPKRSKKKVGKAQEEKRRLTEELLRERRQLEARRFAEQKSRVPEVTVTEGKAAKGDTEPLKPAPEVAETEQSGEGAAQQVQEEAAATDVSFEHLLSEVLEEYLA